MLAEEKETHADPIAIVAVYTLLKGACLSVLYLMTLSVSKPVWCPLVGRMANHDLEKMRQEEGVSM